MFFIKNWQKKRKKFSSKPDLYDARGDEKPFNFFEWPNMFSFGFQFINHMASDEITAKFISPRDTLIKK